MFSGIVICAPLLREEPRSELIRRARAITRTSVIWVSSERQHESIGAVGERARKNFERRLMREKDIFQPFQDPPLVFEHEWEPEMHENFYQMLEPTIVT